MGACNYCIDRAPNTAKENIPFKVPYKPTMKLKISRSASKMTRKQHAQYTPILDMLMDTTGVMNKSDSSNATSSSHAMKTIKLQSSHKSKE